MQALHKQIIEFDIAPKPVEMEQHDDAPTPDDEPCSHWFVAGTSTEKVEDVEEWFLLPHWLRGKVEELTSNYAAQASRLLEKVRKAALCYDEINTPAAKRALDAATAALQKHKENTSSAASSTQRTRSNSGPRRSKDA